MLLNQIIQGLYESLSVIILFGLFSLFFHTVLFKKGFFSIPSFYDQRKWSVKNTLWCFAIFIFSVYFFSPTIAAKIIFFFKQKGYKVDIDSVEATALTQFLNCFSMLFLFIFYLSSLPKGQVKPIFKEHSSSSHSLFYDIFIAAIVWFISFPAIISVNRTLELVNQVVFKTPEKIQVAVEILKNSTSSFTAMMVSLFMVLIAAPAIEEFLFRGCLQNSLRLRFGRKWGIFLASVVFGFMHYSRYQGVTNIPLIVSLTIFSFYLGFVYEKTRSLYSSIFLHVIFNGVNVIRILYF